MENKCLECLKYVHPAFVKEDSSISCIKSIAREFVIPMSSISLVNEWILLLSENISSDGSLIEDLVIQCFWNSVFSVA